MSTRSRRERVAQQVLSYYERLIYERRMIEREGAIASLAT
jgi:hypothetical protein